MLGDDELNSLALPRAAWRKLSRELHTLQTLLRRLRSSSSDERRLGLIGLTGAEADLVASLATCAEVTSVAPDEVSPMVLM